jgi:uncharacterized protein (DUF305 family)
MQRGMWIGVCGAVALLASAASATDLHGGHEAHEAPVVESRDNAPTRAYKAAMAKMHGGMDVRYTGDADRDFVNGMIPHHQGAVEMSEIVLNYGKDPDVRRLARSIIIAQKKEIRYMEKLRAKYKAGNGHAH